MQVDREEFVAALVRVKPALSSGGRVAALSHIWFDEKAVYAFDGGFGIRLALKTELNCGVPGSALMGLLGTSALKEAELEVGENALRVKFGKSTSKLATLEPDASAWRFPVTLPKKKEPVKLDELFMEALRKTLFVKASSPERVEHYGVIVQKRKRDLFLGSADKIAIASAVVKGAAADVEFERVIFPRTFAEQLVAQSPEGVDLYVLGGDSNCLVAVGDGITFYSNMMDLADADNLDELVSRQRKTHPEAVPLPAGFEAALNRAEILAGREEPVVELETVKGALNVSGDYGLGQLDEKLDLEETLPAAKFRAKAGVLRRALPYSESFSITKNTLLMSGADGFTYVVGSL